MDPDHTKDRTSIGMNFFEIQFVRSFGGLPNPIDIVPPFLPVATGMLVWALSGFCQTPSEQKTVEVCHVKLVVL